jgi:hypothetical protein
MKVLVTVFFSAVFASGLVWLWIRRWYGCLVLRSRRQVSHADGRIVPGDPPQTLFGNLPAVYRQANRLAAYNGFHTRFGEIVQLFWMWRPQVSVSGYGMALRVLQSNQYNYRKQPPNAVLRRLFGSSVLSENSEGWKRHRALVRDIFSARHVADFHEVFVAHAERLAAKWEQHLSQAEGDTPFDILPDLTALAGGARHGEPPIFRALAAGRDTIHADDVVIREFRHRRDFQGVANGQRAFPRDHGLCHRSLAQRGAPHINGTCPGGTVHQPIDLASIPFRGLLRIPEVVAARPQTHGRSCEQEELATTENGRRPHAVSLSRSWLDFKDIPKFSDGRNGVSGR